jgi:hypothetical protein
MARSMIDRLRTRTGSGPPRTATPIDTPAQATPRPAEGLSFDDASLESRLTWIWGSPRSGTTWLLKLLGHPLDPDPEVPLGFQPPARSPSAPFDVVPVDETFLSNHISPAFGDPRIVNGRWLPGTLNNLLSGKPAYAFSDEYADVWRPELRRLALVRLNGVLDRARREGIALSDDVRVVIKETNGSHASDIVMSLMPTSRMLLLIRDGRDVVDSLLAAYQPGAFMANKQGQAFATPEERAEGLRWAARLWACNTDMTLKAMESHPEELCLAVRYEDVLSDPVGEVAAIHSWLGVDRDRELIERAVDRHAFTKLPEKQKGPLTRNRSAKPGLWRTNLSGEEQAVVQEICGPLLRRFGYDD